MNTKTFRKRAGRGQGLVEYALILALVAIVVVVIISLVGFGLRRNFGLLGGIFGAKYNDTASATGTQITITEAHCYASVPQGKVGLWILGTVDGAPASDLVGITERDLTSVVEADGGGFKYNPLIADSLDLSLCPKSVVIQAKDGATAFAPIIAELLP